MYLTLADDPIVVDQQGEIVGDASTIERGEKRIAYRWIEEEYRNCVRT